MAVSLCRHLFVLGAALCLVASDPAVAFLAHGAIELSMDVTVNPVAGQPRRECRRSVPLEKYVKHPWSVSLAGPEAGSKDRTPASGERTICGQGPSAEKRTDSGGLESGVGFLAAGETVARVVRRMEDERVVEVEIRLLLRELAGVDPGGSAVYRDSELERTVYFTDDADALIPLFVADGNAGTASGLRDVFLRTSVRLIPEEATTRYGRIWIRSEMPLAVVLLDGGAVGKTADDGSLTLRNVPVGLREVRLRDRDGADVRTLVHVEGERTSMVDFEGAGRTSGAPAYGLFSLGKNSQGYEEYRRAADGAVVVRIPAGEFLMGNKETERSPLEHVVYVSDYLMDKTGVTWRQFEKFAAATGRRLPLHQPYWGIHDDHPVVYVTWEDAKGYCEWAGGRLPTEAEREKAARGTDGRKFPWGNEDPTPELAVFRRTWGHEATGAVGTHPAGASPYGLLDMGGNVWEWCSDWYADDSYREGPNRDPKGPPMGIAHVVRGGSWDSRPTVLSASCRSWGHRGYRDGDFGFRCAMNFPR
jgi:formylglycine-generating enzyme required for sulfatase activity